MARSLDRLTIHGFKSIARLDDFELRNLNVMIGGNGAGKTNLVDFFRMLRAMMDGRFQVFVNEQGGDGLFFMGPNFTRQISARLQFGHYRYEFDLAPTTTGVQILEERVQHTGGYGPGKLNPLETGLLESCIPRRKDDPADLGQGKGVPSYVYESVHDWTVYHFHDTRMVAPMRRLQSARDNLALRHDASNLAAFLAGLRTASPDAYQRIVDTVRLVIPFFNTFLLNEKGQNGEPVVELDWLQKGSDFPFGPNHLSDGSIRFICLATALLQPRLPSTIIIDEPELGLHPYAIEILAELIQAASDRTQVVVSTQSPPLVDAFLPEDVVVVNRRDGASTFERLTSSDLQQWLDEYSLGELWRKNVVAGGPVHE